MTMSFLILSALLLTACGGSKTEEAAPAPPTPEPDALVAQEMEDADSQQSLTPSPNEVVRAMRAIGMDVKIAELIPERNLDIRSDNKHIAAVWTGIVAADAIFTGEEASQEDFLGRLKSVELGMKTIGAGAGVQNAIADTIIRVENGTASRSEFLREFEELLAMKVPGEGWGPDDPTGILVQAGTWLAGVNLVSKAIVQSGRTGAAQTLLRHGDVVDHFLEYVRTEGMESIPREGLQPLNDTLVKIGEITRKTELLTLDDARAVETMTSEILGLLVAAEGTTAEGTTAEGTTAEGIEAAAE
jgi:hypothetical protein